MGGMRMNSKDFAILKKQFDKAQELRNFEKMLKENPMQEAELQNLVLGSELENDTKQRIWAGRDKLRKAGLMVDTIPETFEAFSERAESDKKYPIRASELKQATNEQFDTIKSVKFAVYDDLKGSQYVTHYNYKDASGFPRTTGKGISVRHLDSNDPEQIANASKFYGQTQTRLTKIVEDINVRSNEFEAYMPKKED